MIKAERKMGNVQLLNFSPMYIINKFLLGSISNHSNDTDSIDAIRLSIVTVVAMASGCKPR